MKVYTNKAKYLQRQKRNGNNPKISMLIIFQNDRKLTKFIFVAYKSKFWIHQLDVKDFIINS